MAAKWVRPWVLGGHFNIIRFSCDKKGGCPINSAMRAFSDWIGIQNLVDLPLGGAKYTRSNRQEESVMSRLIGS